ncbi:MAG: nucleotidyltransferase domain-containing protein [Planctomycetota bacterium]
MATTEQEILAHLRRREAERQARAKERASRLLALMPEARCILVERHGASRVVLFGSLANNTPSESCDVDLAVEGLDPGQYFQALADLLHAFMTPVDLVRLEEASETLLERIRSEGREL